MFSISSHAQRQVLLHPLGLKHKVGDIILCVSCFISNKIWLLSYTSDKCWTNFSPSFWGLGQWLSIFLRGRGHAYWETVTSHLILLLLQIDPWGQLVAKMSLHELLSIFFKSCSIFHQLKILSDMCHHCSLDEMKILFNKLKSAVKNVSPKRIWLLTSRTRRTRHVICSSVDPQLSIRSPHNLATTWW